MSVQVVEFPFEFLLMTGVPPRIEPFLRLIVGALLPMGARIRSPDILQMEDFAYERPAAQGVLEEHTGRVASIARC